MNEMRERFEVMLETLQGRAKHPTLTTIELAELIALLMFGLDLLNKLAGEWKRKVM